MKTTIKIQELSDGRFRNSVTGKIGDSIRAVAVMEDAISERDDRIIGLQKVLRNDSEKMIKEFSNGNFRVAKMIAKNNMTTIDAAESYIKTRRPL